MGAKRMANKKASSAKANQKPKEKKPNPLTLSAEKNMMLEPGDNAKYLANALRVARLPKVDLYDPEAVEKRISEYYSIQIENDIKPTVTGLANALGVSSQELWEIRTGKFRENRNGAHGGIAGLPRESAEAIKRAHSILKNLWEDYMQNGKINPVAGIFLGTNNFGMKNTRDIVVETAEDNSDSRTESELIKSAGLLPSDSDSEK